jgi:hypothetical protein
MVDRPPKADFAIVIDFARDEANPQRIFQAADALITAFQEFDRMLVKSIDSSIEPILILEDIEWSPDDEEIRHDKQRHAARTLSSKA